MDPDVVVGGPGLAYWLQANPVEFPDDQRVSGTYFAEQISNSSLPLNFFSFHAIAACTDAITCNIKNVPPHTTLSFLVYVVTGSKELLEVVPDRCLHAPLAGT